MIAASQFFLPSIASVLLTLAALCTLPKGSVGVPVQLAYGDSRLAAFGGCGTPYLTLTPQGYRVYGQPITPHGLTAHLQMQFRSRAERFMLLEVDPDVSWRELVEAVSHIRSSLPGMRVVLVTPGALAEGCLTTRPLAPLAKRAVQPFPLPEPSGWW